MSARLLFGKTDAWSPWAIRTQLRCWLSADDHGLPALMTDDGGGLISSWSDRATASGAVTGATTERPVWGNNSFNGSKAGVKGDGVAQSLLLAPVPASWPTGGNPGMSVVVYDNMAVVASTFFAWGGGGAGEGRNTGCDGTGRIRVGNGYGPMIVTGPVAFGAHIAIGQFEATTITGWLDGTQFGQAVGAVNTLTHRVRTHAAASATPLPALLPASSATLRHVLVLAGVVSAADRERIEGWAAWDGGIQAKLPATHPYRLAPP